MYIILLSGGSGKRLWPLSNDIRSKQFIKIFKKPQLVAGQNKNETTELLPFSQKMAYLKSQYSILF